MTTYLVDKYTQQRTDFIIHIDNMGHEVDVAGLRLESPVMVGAGPIKTLDQVKEIAESDAAAIVVGSITVQAREGNPGTTYYAEDGFSINSKGLPNPGLEYYKVNLPEMVQIAHDHGKPLIVSIAGFSAIDFGKLAEAVAESHADGVEGNFGCPNAWKDGKQKQIISYYPDLAYEALMQMEKEIGVNFWTAIKVSPYEPGFIPVMADLVSGFDMVNAVTTTNTFPNVYSFNDILVAAIPYTDGFGGYSGEAMRPVGMGQVKGWRLVLPPKIAIIGVGGISKARHVQEYVSPNVGATAVQLTTAFINYGPSIFTKVKTED